MTSSWAKKKIPGEDKIPNFMQNTDTKRDKRLQIYNSSHILFQVSYVEIQQEKYSKLLIFTKRQDFAVTIKQIKNNYTGPLVLEIRLA